MSLTPPQTNCPQNSFPYNTTLCSCNPGYLYNATTASCNLFAPSQLILSVDSGFDYYSFAFPMTIFDFDSIKKFTQSQAVFLEATLFLLVSWLLFCLFVRLAKLGDGRTFWFKIRWLISRLDVCYATRHWLEDQKVVKKRKTELGGTFSIASWILFFGLFAALLYQIISARTVEVHNVRATNAPDLASFINDFEFNITTISSMSCSNLHGLGTLFTGNPGSVDHRVVPLSTFVNYTCQNTTRGPTIMFSCSSCQLIRDNAYVSWMFVDLPNNPATAVGFQFNLTAKNHASTKHASFVSGVLKNGSKFDSKPITYRGTVPNVLEFNFFPRIYRNMHDLRLIQPLFHEFLPGSSFDEISQLQASLQRSSDGLINTTLYMNFLSAYIVEIDSQNIMGPVSFLADLGGLYCISIGLFYYMLLQCEYRIKKLRIEDRVMLKIRNRRKAQDQWAKLRKYVTYTWGRCSMDDDLENGKKDGSCSGGMMTSVNRDGSTHRRWKQSKMDTIISFNRKSNSNSLKKTTLEVSGNQIIEPSREGMSKYSRAEPAFQSDIPVVKGGKQENTASPHEGDTWQPHVLPPLPKLESMVGSENSITDIQNNIQNLYEYTVMLGEKLAVAESMLHSLTEKASSSKAESHKQQ